VKAHPFRPLDAVLGLGVIAVGVLVAVFGFEELDEDNVFVWLVIAAGVLGLSLLPWPHRRGVEPVSVAPAPETVETQTETDTEDVSSPLPDESSPDV
jgi:hypothetical protein